MNCPSEKQKVHISVRRIELTMTILTDFGKKSKSKDGGMQ